MGLGQEKSMAKVLNASSGARMALKEGVMLGGDQS
jgi:hypothetical protein